MARPPMRLATIESCLGFLQAQYGKFKALNQDQREQTVEFNELVRRNEEKHDLPLRTLYIDLVMHDELVRSIGTSGTVRSIGAAGAVRSIGTSGAVQRAANQPQLATVMRNKVAIERMIRRREQLGESVVPVDVLSGDELSAFIVKWLKEAEIPASERRAVERALGEWQRHGRSEDASTAVMDAIIRASRVMTDRNAVQDFRTLVFVYESIATAYESIAAEHESISTTHESVNPEAAAPS